jgi:hypothetical protein
MRELRHPRVAFASAVLVAAAGLAAGASAATAPPRPAETGTIYSVAGAGLFLIGGQAVAPAAPDGGPAGVTRLAYPTGVAALPTAASWSRSSTATESAASPRAA